MEMRTCGLSGIAALADAIASLELHALRNADDAQMGISGFVAEFVI